MNPEQAMLYAERTRPRREKLLKKSERLPDVVSKTKDDRWRELFADAAKNLK
jgi:hypothetical protein